MSKMFRLPVRQGSTGAAVNLLALILAGGPYDPEEKIQMDGDFTPEGEIAKALKRLQLDKGLEETGNLDDATFSVLCEECNFDLSILTEEMFSMPNVYV